VAHVWSCKVDLLTKLGTKFVVNSSSDTFKKDLYKEIDATGATLAFDAMDQGVDQGVKVPDLRKFY
jgi:hypothetical protein